MSEGEHRAKVEKRKAHNPPKSGCVTRCQGGKYVEDNAHSHRWNAAEQARAETEVYKIPLGENANIPNWRSKALKRLDAEGGLIGRVRKHRDNQMKPFYRMWSPFSHNAHHIVPMGVLWEKVIAAAVAKAKNDPGKMFDLVVDGLLKEPYNHNDRPNMITLPTAVRESKLLGLPMHLNDKAFDHPDYTAPIARQVSAEIPPKYTALADAVNKGRHVKKKELVKIKGALVPISTATYQAILALAKAKKLANRTLDQAAKQIARLAALNG